MKKILSLLLAVMMLSSLITVGVNAEGENVVFSITAPEDTFIESETITVSVLASITEANAVASFGIEVTTPTGLTLTTVTPKGIFTEQPGSASVGSTGFTWAIRADQAKHTNGAAAEIAELVFTVDEVAATAPVEIGVSGTIDIANAVGTMLTYNTATATVSLARTFAVADGGVTAPEDVHVDFGTTEDAVIAQLADLGVTVEGEEGDTATLKADDNGWTCDDTYSATTVGTYVFSATLEAVTPVTGFTTAADAEVAVNVIVDGLALPVEDVVLDAVAVKQDKNAAEPALWSDLVESGDLKLPTEVTIGEGDTEKTFDLSEAVWEIDGAGEGTLDLVNPTDDSTYAGNVVDLTTTVTVVDNDKYVDGEFAVDVQVYVKKKVVSTGGGKAPGIPQKDTTGGDTTTPDDGEGTTTPEDGEGTTTPEDGEGTTTPEDGEGTTTPEDGEGTTTPEDVEMVPGTADVPATHWAAPYIAKLVEAGVVSGDADGNFNADADITRAEATKMVVKLLGAEATAAAEFEDVAADAWYAPFVAAGVEAGIVTGYSETEFAPENTITRQELFTIVGRAIATVSGDAATLDFADAHAIEEYAAPYISLLVEMGIIDGYEDGSIRPVNNITRAEVAKVVAALMDILAADAPVAE